VNEFRSKKLKPHLRIQKNPESRSKYIVSLNSETFKQVIFDNSSDVFVFFTSKVCRLCNEFWPTYINAAKVLNKSRNMIFTTIDMSNNELDDQNIYYYPTIRYYPTNSKYRPFDYD
jgi:thioredoxin-like negative regulator of GroEL